MLFRKKEPVNQEELDLKIFKTKVELRRILEKYEAMMERELRFAREQKQSGSPRPSNYERIRTLAGLISTTQAAYQEMDDISTTDELNRTTSELTAVLQDMNRITGKTQRADVGGLRRGIGQMQSTDARLTREYQNQSRVMNRVSGGRYEAELDAILADALQPEQPAYVQPAAAPQNAVPMTDAELKAQMDEIDRHLYGVLEDI
ncbi:MAG: hypothetical protein E7466_00885 [Ruminococcaceae bacterium]|nr:hypothetical protein [Oscillospiraceae bacterium]